MDMSSLRLWISHPSPSFLHARNCLLKPKTVLPKIGSFFPPPVHRSLEPEIPFEKYCIAS